MAAFKFNLQQLDLLGAYDRYTKELEDQKKQELYDNKLVEQEVDDFAKYYNPNSVRGNDKPILYSTFKTYETAAKSLNKARRLGNVDEINRYREQMQKAIADMGDIYNNAVTAKGVAAEFQKLYNMQKDGKVVIDSKTFEDDWNLFTNGSLDSIKQKYGSSDKWGNAVTGLEYTNNKYTDDIYKAKTAFSKNPVGFKITPTGKYEEEKLPDGRVVKLYPIVERAPVYEEALKIASLQNESTKRKALQEFKQTIAQGGPYADIAILKQNKIASAFKVAPENITADMLLAFTIAPEPIQEADKKAGIDKWKMDMQEAQFKYKQELDKKKIEIAKARAANKGKSGGKITSMELNLLTNYYKESKDNFTSPNGDLTNPSALNTFLEGVDPKIVGFIHEKAPKTKSDPKEMNKVLQGYMKNPQSFFAAMNPN